MGIASRSAWRLVPEQRTDNGETIACINEQTGVAMAQIVNARVVQISGSFDAIPCVAYRGARDEERRAGKDVLASVRARLWLQFPEQRYGFVGQRQSVLLFLLGQSVRLRPST